MITYVTDKVRSTALRLGLTHVFDIRTDAIHALWTVAKHVIWALPNDENEQSGGMID